MKILFVVQNYYPSVGGTQIFFQNIAESCANDFGDDVELFTTDSYFGPDKTQFRKILPKEEIINKVKIKRFAFFRFHLFFSRRFTKILNRFFNTSADGLKKYISGPWSPAMTNAIKKTDADVIFAGTSNYMYMLYPLYRDKLNNKKPFVFQGAIHFNKDKKVKVISKQAIEAIKKSDYYLSNTAYENERLAELGVDARKIIIGGSCVDIDLFAKGKRNIYREKFDLKSEDILLGYIGRIEATKNIELLLEAVQISFSEGEKINLVIAGYQNPAYVNKLKLLINGLDSTLQQKIHLLTDLNEEQKIDLFNALDIFVSPSENESFGMVFLEAWSCKKPVIAASIGAIRSVVSNDVDGMLFSPGDVADLAKKISALSDDTNLQQKMGENGYTKTLQNHTLKVVAKKYRDTFIKAKENFNVC